MRTSIIARAGVGTALALPLPFAAACSGGDSGTVTQTATVPASSAASSAAPATTVTEAATEPGAAGAAQAPCEVASINDYARAEMTKEGVSEEQLKEAVAQGCKMAERDDAIWEIEYQGIDVDITDAGEVVDVDR